MTDTKTKEVTESVKCDKCGLECTTGAMAAFCQYAEQCEFWPHSDGSPEQDGAELLMAQMWMHHTLDQIGLQIEDRKRLERELAEADAAAKRWYVAASPYAVPEALAEAIKGFSEEQRRLIACVPTTWLDPLLTGETKVISEPPWNGPDIERLLRAIRERMEAK